MSLKRFLGMEFHQVEKSYSILKGKIILNSKYKVVIIIGSLLALLSVSILGVNYVAVMNNAKNQITKQSLPLSLDNMYSKVQKRIVEPYLISSMMAKDVFLHNWMREGEEDKERIYDFLKSIKQNDNVFSAFLASDASGKYYTDEGAQEDLVKENPEAKWYFDFKNREKKHIINVNYAEKKLNTIMMYINYKIFDNKDRYLGVAGIVLKLSNVNKLLKKFRENHNLVVTFFDKEGNVVLSEKDMQVYNHIDKTPELKKYKKLILSQDVDLVEYYKNSELHIIKSKYIPELDVYLVIDANLEDFIKNTKNTLYVSILISLILTIIIMLIIYFVVKKYTTELELLSNYDKLTDLPNRGYFQELFQKQILRKKRDSQELALLFMDIDNFKAVNDDFGHDKGDLVLKSVAQILQENIRQTDLIARWGGEEFIIALIDSSLENSKAIATKLQLAIEKDTKLQNALGRKITGSFGLTMIKESDTEDLATIRADEAMYEAKKSGKNRVVVK